MNLETILVFILAYLQKKSSTFFQIFHLLGKTWKMKDFLKN